MRYWFLTLHIQCGEYEFFSESVHKTEWNDMFDAEAYASGFYGNADPENDPDSGNYYFNNGEVCVSVYTLKEISKPVYNVLWKFL